MTAVSRSEKSAEQNDEDALPEVRARRGCSWAETFKDVGRRFRKRHAIVGSSQPNFPTRALKVFEHDFRVDLIAHHSRRFLTAQGFVKRYVVLVILRISQRYPLQKSSFVAKSMR